MKKKILFLLTILLIPFICVKALNYKDVKINNYANDYSNVLSPELEQYINEKSQQLEDLSKAQMVVVTIPSLEGEDLEEFSNDLFNYVKIGDKELNNGLLILLVTEDRLLRVEVGEGLEGCLNDGKVGRYEDFYMINHLRNNDWENAIKDGYNAFFNEIVTEYDLDLEKAPVREYTSTNILSSKLQSFFFFLFFFPTIIGIARNGKEFGIIDWIILGIIISPAIIARIFKGPELAGIIGVMCCLGILFFVFARFASSSGRYHGSSGGSSWSGGGGHSSGGGFSGGGGHSSGGGASRSF